MTPLVDGLSKGGFEDRGLLTLEGLVPRRRGGRLGPAADRALSAGLGVRHIPRNKS